MPYQIFFTQIAGSTMPANASFLQPFLKSIREGLSTDATVETDLRKPLQYGSETLWLFCFGKNGVLYRIENETQIKVILLLASQKDEGFCEADLVEIIQTIQTQNAAAEQIFQYRNEPISMSLEEIERDWLPNEEEQRRWAKAKLDLVAECGSNLEAQQFYQYFDGMVLDLVDQAQYRCRVEVLQDVEQNWWCWIRPISISTIPKNQFQMKELQRLLYDRLHFAPIFRYAFSTVGAYEYLFTGESPTGGTYSQVLQGNIPLFSYSEGIVLSETVWNIMKSPPTPKLIKPFRQGYVWIPIKTPRIIRATDYEPMLDPDPQSAEEYYNNGSILGHRGQHREAMIAFEIALVLNPTLHLAAVGRETARRHLYMI